MDDEPKPPLANDPNLLANLDQLDRGLAGSGDAASSADEMLAYQRFYGFDEKPFTLSTDPKFFYHSTVHDSVARDLLDAVRNREALVVVTGETGTGKTTLCRAVVDELDRRTLASLVIDPIASIEGLLEILLIDFGVMSREAVADGRLRPGWLDKQTSALGEFLGSLAPLRAFVVVLIDEAQNAPSDVLKRLCTLFDLEGAQRLLQIVLVGQPALLRVLGRPELRPLAERASVRSRLVPLAEEEVAGYVMHRIALAGGNARVEFGDEALAAMYELSAGVPLVINRLCDRALALGAESAIGVIHEELIWRAADDLDIAPPESATWWLARCAFIAVFAIGLFLVGAAGAGFVFQDRLSQLVVRWETIPLAPSTPTPPGPAPLRPLPPPMDMAGSLAPQS